MYVKRKRGPGTPGGGCKGNTGCPNPTVMW